MLFNEAEFQSDLFQLMKRAVDTDETVHIEDPQSGNNGEEKKLYRPDVLLYNIKKRFAWIELKYVRANWMSKTNSDLFKLGEGKKLKTFEEHV